MALPPIDFDKAVDEFYRHLFSEFPLLVDVFPDMEKQRSMLVTALRTIFYQGDDQNLDDYLEMLGEKHKELGVLRVHMDAAERALEKAIALSGDDLTADQLKEYRAAIKRMRTAMGYRGNA